MGFIKKNSHKRKLQFNDNQNANKKLKTQINNDSHIIKYIIKCTKNNTKLLEDLKYIFKSNEISDFSKRLKKYILKREKIEKEYNENETNIEKENEEKNERQYEQLPQNNKRKKGKNKDNDQEQNHNQYNDQNQLNNNNMNEKTNPIHFVFRDKKKNNIKEVLIIKPVNEIEINDINFNYCQLDTTNRYLLKRIRKEHFKDAFDNDHDFQSFVIFNYHLFKSNNTSTSTNTEMPEQEGNQNVNEIENQCLVQEKIYNNNNNNNDNDNFQNPSEDNENTYNNIENNNINNIQEAQILEYPHINENEENDGNNNNTDDGGNNNNNNNYNNSHNHHHSRCCKNKHSNNHNHNYNNNIEEQQPNNKIVKDVIYDEESIEFPSFAKNSFGLDEYNERENSYKHYFFNNINEKCKIVYGKEVPFNLNEEEEEEEEEYDDGNKENNNPYEIISDKNYNNDENDENNENNENNNNNNNQQKYRISSRNENNNTNNTNISTNISNINNTNINPNNTNTDNILLDTDIEIFRAKMLNNENSTGKKINTVKEIFNEENENKNKYLSNINNNNINNNTVIYSNDEIEEINKTINNPIIDKIIQNHKNKKKIKMNAIHNGILDLNSNVHDNNENYNNDIDNDNNEIFYGSPLSKSLPRLIENYEASEMQHLPNFYLNAPISLSTKKLPLYNSTSIKNNKEKDQYYPQLHHQALQQNQLFFQNNDNLEFQENDNYSNDNNVDDNDNQQQYNNEIDEIENENQQNINNNFNYNHRNRNKHININNNNINNNNNNNNNNNDYNNDNNNCINENNCRNDRDIIKQKYMKRKSDQKAYWPTFNNTYEDPSTDDFTTIIQKKSLFSPYLQYLILLNKEVNNKKGENEEEVIRKIKNEQINNNSMAGGYIVLNKDIKGSWTNPEIMKNIKKQRVVNNELNLLLPLKCVVYDCSTFNKYVKEERLMYYIRLYQKVNIEHHPFYIDIVVETINEEDTYEYTLLFSVPVEAFDMYLSEIEEENNINKYRNDENENEAEEEMNNDYHQYQHKHRHHYKHNKQYDINKAEIHIEHFDGQYDHFKISSMMGRNNIVEFIQILRKCRGLDYNKTLPIPTQFKNSCNKIKETERKLKHHQTKQQIMKETFMINDKKEE